MELIKKSERIISASTVIQGVKASGAKVKSVGEFRKWKELHDGSRLSVSMTVYQIEANGVKAWFLSDTLGKVASVTSLDFADVMAWLKNHGYKTEHDFYIQDYGMTEETWKEWNSEG